MDARFYVNGFRNLMVDFGGKTDTVIAPRFMQNDSKSKAADYLRTVANKLNEVFPVDQDAAWNLIEEAKAKVQAAQTAEKSMKEVTF